ncbi:MAG: L-threonylcarbamoyladenylate synthase [Pseudomonadota bacterium]
MTQQSPIVPANLETIAKAAEIIRAGQLVALPTETVYGLGADATNPEAVAKIFTAKGRPSFNPLIVHVASLELAGTLAEVTPLAERLAANFWPGPLTLILPRDEQRRIPDITVAGLDTIAIRIPNHPIALELLIKAEVPIAAPSANRSGHVSATTAAHVADDFGASVSLILDAGPTVHGVESTVIDATGSVPVILRPGAITAEALTDVIGAQPETRSSHAASPTSPGQLESHYAPNCRVRLNATDVRPNEHYLAFGPAVPDGIEPLANLSPCGDLVEAATNLFAILRHIDQPGIDTVAIAPIPNTGIGVAINDRLRRAAAPRPVVNGGIQLPSG